jgi:hypothetical protein
VTSPQIFKRLTKLATSWGAKVVAVERPEPMMALSTYFRNHRDFYIFTPGAPIGLLYRQKKIVYWKDTRPSWDILLHEMAHLFAVRRNPDTCNEYSFLGWEYALALRLGCARRLMARYKNYWVDYTASGVAYQAIGDMPMKVKQKLFQSRLAYARRRGLVRLGVPVRVR